MPPDAAPFDPHGAVPDSAHQLEQAAAELQGHAADPGAVPTYGITLAHVEEALDRLAIAMELMTNAVAEWSGEPSAIVQERVLPPEARALRWHLGSVADNLRASADACAVSGDWTRRLFAGACRTASA
jgi:hypothetical protein